MTHVIGYASQAKTITLLSNATATTPTLPKLIWHGGEGMFHAVGTFNGSSVNLQFLSDDGSTWCTACSVADATPYKVTIAEGKQIRAQVSGGVSPTGLYASFTQV